MSKMNSVNDQVQQVAGLGESICREMNQTVLNAGFDSSPLPDDGIQCANFTGKIDPFSKQETLEGIWKDNRGQRCGSILFHGDGSFYAEYDVVRPHPTKKDWFVESVTAWGKDDSIKAELQLLPAVN